MTDTNTHPESVRADVSQCGPPGKIRPHSIVAQLDRMRSAARGPLLGALIVLSAFCTSHDAQADELHYESFWVKDQATSLHTAPLSLANFKKVGQSLAENGYVLIDIETAVLDGQRRYAGLWTQGSGSTIFEGPIGAIAMREAMDRRLRQGLLLTDFEVFNSANGGRQYLGVWRSGSGKQLLTGPMTQDAFIARGLQLMDENMRLRDVEIQNVDGRLLYSGLFRSGAGLNVLTLPTSMAQFRNALPGRVAEGMELIDYEKIDGTQNVVGVFRSGDALAEITGLRDFPAQFALAQSQYADGRRTRDFELSVIETPDNGGGPTDPNNPPPLPANPSNVSFTDGYEVRLEFQEQVDEALFHLTLPTAALPDWLPRLDDVTPILPDGDCGLLVRKAAEIYWQLPGDPAVITPPFIATPSVQALDLPENPDLPPPTENFYLGGIRFSGPMGGCTDTQEPWSFPFPFTTEGPFVPLPNLSLAIQLNGLSEIHFIKNTGPSPKPIDVDKLFKDDSMKKLKDMVKFWNDLLEEGQNVDKYCPTIGNFWKKLCSQFPESDEVCSAEVAELPDC